MTLLFLIAGSALGAPLRYLTDRAVQARHRSSFPLGTFTVNMIACLVLGIVVGAGSAGHASHDTQVLLGTGLCGTLSTYSTFSYETLRLAETGAAKLAILNVVASVGVGIGAAFLGAAIAKAAW
jgi:fluoride exporter